MCPSGRAEVARKLEQDAGGKAANFANEQTSATDFDVVDAAAEDDDASATWRSVIAIPI